MYIYVCVFWGKALKTKMNLLRVVLCNHWSEVQPSIYTDIQTKKKRKGGEVFRSPFFSFSLFFVFEVQTSTSVAISTKVIAILQSIVAALSTLSLLVENVAEIHRKKNWSFARLSRTCFNLRMHVYTYRRKERKQSKERHRSGKLEKKKRTETNAVYVLLEAHRANLSTSSVREEEEVEGREGGTAEAMSNTELSFPDGATVLMLTGSQSK